MDTCAYSKGTNSFCERIEFLSCHDLFYMVRFALANVIHVNSNAYTSYI